MVSKRLFNSLRTQWPQKVKYILLTIPTHDGYSVYWCCYLNKKNARTSSTTIRVFKAVICSYCTGLHYIFFGFLLFKSRCSFSIFLEGISLRQNPKCHSWVIFIVYFSACVAGTFNPHPLKWELKQGVSWHHKSVTFIFTFCTLHVHINKT